MDARQVQGLNVGKLLCEILGKSMWLHFLDFPIDSISPASRDLRKSLLRQTFGFDTPDLASRSAPYSTSWLFRASSFVSHLAQKGQLRRIRTCDNQFQGSARQCVPTHDHADPIQYVYFSDTLRILQPSALRPANNWSSLILPVQVQALIICRACYRCCRLSTSKPRQNIVN